MAAVIDWNPPPHALTKPPITSWQPYFSGADSDLTLPTGKFGAVPKTIAGRLGAIYTPEAETESYKLTSPPNRYGVQFHYNPTSISFGARTDASISIQSIETQTEAIPLGSGSTSVSLELYFNRIYDMATTPQYSSPLGKTPAGEDRLKMIEMLGTQYDIEYLYRVINGKPRPSKTVSYDTSDFGIIVLNPVNIRIGPFKWLGFVSGITIDHILFTPQMVPTFTKVNIDFQRLLTLEGYKEDGTSLRAPTTDAATPSLPMDVVKNWGLTSPNGTVALPPPGSTGGGYVRPLMSTTQSRSYSGHSGVDYPVPTGTPVYAVDAGTIEYTGYGRGYGNAVFMTDSHGIKWVYGHNSATLVNAGQNVVKGQQIAKAGSTGNSTGPHVHLEAARGGSFNKSSNRDYTLGLMKGAGAPR